MAIFSRATGKHGVHVRSITKKTNSTKQNKSNAKLEADPEIRPKLAFQKQVEEERCLYALFELKEKLLAARIGEEYQFQEAMFLRDDQTTEELLNAEFVDSSVKNDNSGSIHLEYDWEPTRPEPNWFSIDKYDIWSSPSSRSSSPLMDQLG